MTDTSGERVFEGPRTVALLELLCAYFDTELKRQGRILEACEIQGHAARSHEVAALERATQDLAAHLEEAFAGEQQRHYLLRQLVDRIGLDESEQTLTGLIAVSPEPFRGRMREFQVAMRGTLDSTRCAVRKNAVHLRRVSRIVDDSIHAMLGGSAQKDRAYDKDGNGPSSTPSSPALVNTVG